VKATTAFKMFAVLALLLVGLGAGCDVGSPAMPPPTATPAPTATPTRSPTRTPAPAPTPTLPLPVPPPPFLYIHENKLLERTGGVAPRLLADLPDAGEVLDARMVGDVVLVLRWQGLQRVRLTKGTTDLLLRFEAPARFGALTLDGTQVIYEVRVDDPQADEFSMGMGTGIGLYDVESGAIRTTLYFTRAVHVVGLTAEGNGLYLVPVGQELGFNKLLVADLESGAIQAEYEVGGLQPALAPNRCFIATFSNRPALTETMYIGVLNVYGLLSQPIEPQVVDLPHPPSFPVALWWSPDSRSLYLVLHPGYQWEELVGSHGLWRLDVASGALSQLVAGKPDREPFVTFSPDGQWVLLRHSDEEVVTRIHLPTGALESFTLPAVAVETSTARGEEALSFLSPDGQWLLLKHIQRGRFTGTATIVHLPSGASQSFTLPGEAVVVGWR